MIHAGLVGVVLCWLGAIGLVTWDTLGGPRPAFDWGMLLAAGAAAWTVTLGQRRRVADVMRQMHNVYEIGRDSRDGEVHHMRR